MPRLFSPDIQSRAPCQTPRVGRGPGTVLIVDDEAVVRSVAGSGLKRRGFQVLVAESGADAIQVLENRAGEISLVLLDLNMPGMWQV